MNINEVFVERFTCFCPYNECQWGPKHHMDKNTYRNSIFVCVCVCVCVCAFLRSKLRPVNCIKTVHMLRFDSHVDFN